MPSQVKSPCSEETIFEYIKFYFIRVPLTPFPKDHHADFSNRQGNRVFCSTNFN